MLGAAHKPGAMPLRPLGLGDIYDAAFRIIRFNPRATVGSAVLVAAVAMALPLLVTPVLTAAVDLSLDQGRAPAPPRRSGGRASARCSWAVLQGLGLIFVTGMIAHVTAAAAIGRRLTLGEAWAATRGSRWRLVGLSVLLGLLASPADRLRRPVGAGVVLLPAWAIVVFGLVSVPLFIAGCVVVLGPRLLPAGAGADARAVGVIGAIGRASG